MTLNQDAIVKGQYQILHQVGQGGFGVTYLAKDNHQPDIAEPIILKQIRLPQANGNGQSRDTNYLKMLETEAQTLWNLSLLDRRIPKFFAKFEEGEYFYLAQEYIEGHDLSREIVAGVRIHEEQAIAMLQAILQILRFVHSNNIIHRDIKPANIIRRNSDQKLFLIDFGAVTESATLLTSAGISRTRAICTDGYAPAEQLAGMPQFNSDIYALGIMMMQTVTGSSIQAICDSQSIPRRDPSDNYRYDWESYAPHINPQIKQIISRIIEYNYQTRYQSAEKIINDLEEYTSGTIVVNPEPLEQRTAPPTQIINSETSELDITETSKIIDHSWFSHRFQPWLRFLAIAIIACIATVIIFSPRLQLDSSTIGDNITSGEEVQDPLSKGSIKLKAAEEYQQKKYNEALASFQESWQDESRNAETLIYLNNAFLEANKIDYQTIAVAVPLKTGKDKIIKSSEISQDFLRGFAQAQTEVNLNLLNNNQKNTQQLPGQNILTPRTISSKAPKGLKVVIIDDGNQTPQAQKVAQVIAKQSNILGVIGHYTSKMTLDTVDIYEEKNLAQISYGSTTKELTKQSRDNFFRVVYTNKEEAAALVKYIEQTDYQDKKIAVFYNPSSGYSNNLKIAIYNKLEQFKGSNIQVVKEFDLADEKNFSTHIALQEVEKLGANIFLLLPDGLETNSLAKAVEIIEQDNGSHLILGGNPLINSKVTNIQTTQPLNLVVSAFWFPQANSKSEFQQHTKQLWETNVNGRTAMAYDATVTMIEAIKRQTNPTRKGTIEELKNQDLSVPRTATGEITFNTSKNGDRLNFYPTLVQLVNCGDSNSFVRLSESSKLACQEELR